VLAQRRTGISGHRRPSRGPEIDDRTCDREPSPSLDPTPIERLARPFARAAALPTAAAAGVIDAAGWMEPAGGSTLRTRRRQTDRAENRLSRVGIFLSFFRSAVFVLSSRGVLDVEAR
jgi:hypothetical protein